MKLVILLILCVNAYFIKAQDTLPVQIKQVSHSRFVDCYPNKDYLVALSEDGSVYQIRLRDLAVKDSMNVAMKASAIGRDRNGMIWLADGYQSLFSLRDTGWKREYRIAGIIYQFAFDRSNDLFLVTSLGIYNRRTDMFYAPNNYRNIYFRLGSHMQKPTGVYIDDSDNIWMHWNARNGGEIQVFSTKSNTYITSEKKGIKSFAHYSSIVGTGETIFFTQTNGFGMNDIFSYRSDSMRRLLHKEYDTVTVGVPTEQEEYLGGTFFNEADHSLYYFSAKGLFRAAYNAAMDKVGKPQRIMPSQHAWYNNKPNAAEFAMGVSKLLIHEGAVVYLCRDAGIFIFKGNRLYNLR